jgi:hypothetical protein
MMADQNRNQTNQSSGQGQQSSRKTDDMRRTQGREDEPGIGQSSRERTGREPGSTADDRRERERRNMSGEEDDSRLTRDDGMENENVESDLDEIDDDESGSAR